MVLMGNLFLRKFALRLWVLSSVWYKQAWDINVNSQKPQQWCFLSKNVSVSTKTQKFLLVVWELQTLHQQKQILGLCRL